LISPRIELADDTVAVLMLRWTSMVEKMLWYG